MKWGTIIVWVVILFIGYLAGKMYPNLIRLPGAAAG